MEKKDIVIASMEFARKSSLLGDRIGYEDLMRYLIDKKLIEKNSPSIELVGTLHSQICIGSAPKSFISLDAYLGLLDYEDLQLARQDSHEARKEAKKAFYISAASLILATLMSVAQIVVQICFR